MVREIVNIQDKVTMGAMPMLFQSMQAVLETYSNVHRGSGQKSQVTTHLFDEARNVVLDYLGLKNKGYTVIFCTPARAGAFIKQIKGGEYKMVSSQEFGLPFGVRAVAVKKKALPAGEPFQVGGGTTRLYSKHWVLWANEPDRFEAGTPAIVNIIAFARALQLVSAYGKDVFRRISPGNQPVKDIFYNDELKGFLGPDLLGRLQESMIGYGLQVPVSGGLKPFINMDSSASTPTFAPVWDAFKVAFTLDDNRQREIVSEVRAICAKVFGAPAEEYDIIFTSNTTESINLVAGAITQEKEARTEPVILTTVLEHSSNDLPWRRVNNNPVLRLEVNREGFWDLTEAEKILASYNRERLFGNKRIRIVAVSGASNVLGVCNDLEALSKLVHNYGAELLVDGAQLVAHREVNMMKSGIDYLAFSAHKVYAPFGCGVLIARKGMLKLDMQDISVASGEENVGGIAALGKSLLLLRRIGFDTIRQHEQSLTRQAIEGMKKIPGLIIQGITETDGPKFDHKIGVIVFTLKNGIPGITAGKLARNAGIGVRFGCHCAHLIVKQLSGFTPTTEWIQKAVVLMVPALKLQGYVRVSFGLENTSADVEVLLQELGAMAAKENQLSDKPEVKARIREFIVDVEQRVYAR